MTTQLIQVKTAIINSEGDTKYQFVGNFEKELIDGEVFYVADSAFGKVILPTADNNIKLRLELNDLGVQAAIAMKDSPFVAVLF